MNHDLLAVLELFEQSRGIPPAGMLAAIEKELTARVPTLLGPYRKPRVHVDPSTGEFQFFAVLVIVRIAFDLYREIGISAAKEIEAGVRIGEEIEVKLPVPAGCQTASKFARIEAEKLAGRSRRPWNV